MSHSGSSSNISSKTGKESVVEEHAHGSKGEANGKCQLQLPLVDKPAVEEEQKPKWLKVLLRTKFWEPCKGHTAENRAEECMFCLKCYKVFCPHCIHDEPGHCLLKVRRYVYRSVVLAKDMQELNVDVSRIQTYVINGQKGVHLRPMKRSPLFRPPAGAPRCLTCRCWLRNAPNLFCSITCEAKVDVSQDDFSGPEAERRYKGLQTMLAVQPSDAPPAVDQHHLPEAEHGNGPHNAPEPHDAPLVANQEGLEKRSFRRRARKQVEPLRAPFF